jgi:hypothetical protein
VGEDANRRVAEDARVSEGVMLGHYVTEDDEQLRARSNRTFERLTTGLPAEVAGRYGHHPAAVDPLEERFRQATEARDWPLVARLAAELERKRRTSAG